MTRDLTLDARLRRPYSIGTGIPIGGDAEIEGYLESLRVQGFCVIERVIPQDRLEKVRESVIEGRELLEKDRNREREQRVEALRLRLRGAAGDERASDLEGRSPFARRKPPAPNYVILRATNYSRSTWQSRGFCGAPKPCSIPKSAFCRPR